MHRQSRLLVLTTAAIVSAGCAATDPRPAAQPTSVAPASKSAIPAPVARPASELTDHLGDSPETAVTVPADAPNEGIDFQNNWIFDRYGRFRRMRGGIAHAGEQGAVRRYEVVTFELPDHSEHTVYFDITENMKSWKRSAKPQP